MLTKCNMLQYPIKSTLAVVRPTDDDGTKKTMRQAVSVLRLISSDDGKKTATALRHKREVFSL